jgi:excisionase family DNA binding protein
VKPKIVPLDVIPGGVVNQNQAAKELGVSRKTIFEWRERGWLPFYKIGRRVFLSRTHLEKVFQSRLHNAEALES